MPWSGLPAGAPCGPAVAPWHVHVWSSSARSWASKRPVLQRWTCEKAGANTIQGGRRKTNDSLQNCIVIQGGHSEPMFIKHPTNKIKGKRVMIQFLQNVWPTCCQGQITSAQWIFLPLRPRDSVIVLGVICTESLQSYRGFGKSPFHQILEELKGHISCGQPEPGMGFDPQRRRKRAMQINVSCGWHEGPQGLSLRTTEPHTGHHLPYSTRATKGYSTLTYGIFSRPDIP